MSLPLTTGMALAGSVSVLLSREKFARRSSPDLPGSMADH